MASRYRGVAGATLLVVTIVWSAASILGWQNARLIRAADEDKPDLVPPTLIFRSLQAGPERAWARRLQALAQQDKAEAYLRASLRSQPLDASTWVDQAELLMSQHKVHQAAAAVDLARALWPHRTSLMWRAAMLQIQLGQTDRAIAALLADWADAPGDGIRVLALLRRLLPDDAALVKAARGVWQRGRADPVVYQHQLLRVAGELEDTVLAARLWTAVGVAAHSDKKLLLPYLRLLLEAGDFSTAERVWQQTVNAQPGVYNGNFEQPLFEGGFGWCSYKGKGFTIVRENDHAYDGKYSVLIDFAGTHNVNFYHLRQTVVVQPGQTYRLRGLWSGYNVTTRSGVYVDVHAVGSEDPVDAHIDPQFGSWSWHPFNVDIAVPDDVHLLEIAVRRRATDSLDRLISGKVWLDDISLQPVDVTGQE